jgi:DNA-binding beta-propeller fold protein YncE
MRTTAPLLVVVLQLLGAAAAHAQSRDLATYALFGGDKLKLGGRVQVVAGDVGGNDNVGIGGRATLAAPVRVAGDSLKIGKNAVIAGDIFFNQLRAQGASLLGGINQGLVLPLIDLPPPPLVSPSAVSISLVRGEVRLLNPGSYGSVNVPAGATLVLVGGTYHMETLLVRGSSKQASVLRCDALAGCTVLVRTRLLLGASVIGDTGGLIAFEYAGTTNITVGRAGAQVTALVLAPQARVRLKSSRSAPTSFVGSIVARDVKVGTAATVTLGTGPAICGNGTVEAGEDCDPPLDGACPGFCLPDCQCPPPVGTPARLHAVGPTVLHNATPFGVQLFGEDFVPGAVLQLSDKTSGTLITTVPTSYVSSTEMTALVPAGMAVPSGIQRELVARVVNPGSSPSGPPTIGHCQIDQPTSPTACTQNADCPPGTGSCITGDQRLTMFNDLVFRNPNSVAVMPAPYGVCDDGSPCQGVPECGGIGSGACSPKLYVTPQQTDELWVYNTGTGQFVDQNPGQSGIQGIPVGDNPFHVEVLAAGGPARAWVVNRFDDSFSIIDPATDTELARVTGTALGVPGWLRMETEVEFNRAGTRAYLSNENLDEVQVLDISGAQRDAPLLVASIDVGVNPRGMATNAADTRLYVANIQSADVSVVDIAPGSATENQVLATVAARATDDIVGGRADGWEPLVIGGRAPRGIVYSDALDLLFVTSIGPQTGPRQGVVQVGGAIINPTVTVIDAATDSVRAHVALALFDPDRASCTDPELAALDDVRGRLYIACQGSGTVDVLDTAALAGGLPAEVAIVSLPLPTDVTVPTLNLPSQTGAFSAKVCGAFTGTPGAACTSNAQCGSCPTLVEGLPVQCCMQNNPISLHNGPRGIALSSDTSTLYVVNQFTTSVSTLDVSPASPGAITVTRTTSFPGAFGSGTEQRDRRLGQIEFFTDVKKTGISCATCHIDDHQDGVFFEADVRGPRLRRVLSVRGTRDFIPLLQDQLVPDLLSFTDIVVQAERGGPIPCIPCIEIGGTPFCFNGGTCTVTSDSENQQNARYAKAITFFPNPNLNADGSFSTAVPLPGGVTGDATRGAQLFDQLACQSCHPEPLFTIDQLRDFESATLGQPVRMREVGTPVFIPLRTKCQDVNRPGGFDGSTGFTVPTLRGVWDTFPLLLSGSAGLTAVGPEPTFSPGCTPGSAGCCAQLQSPLNPGGTVVPPQHLAVATKDVLRAVLTPPLAVPGTGHGTALGLSPSDLNALIAYIRSL